MVYLERLATIDSPEPFMLLRSRRVIIHDACVSTWSNKIILAGGD